MIQVLFLAKPCNGFFPPSSPLLVQNKKQKERKKERKKKCEFVWQQYIRFRKIFLIFSFSCCKIFVMVVMKVLLHCRVADKWHSVCEKKYTCMCYTLLPTILRKESQFHVTVCLKCKSFKSHSAKYHDINLIRFVFCISQGDDHSLKEGKVCLQVLSTHKLRICLPNSSFRARTFLKSFVPRKRAL